MVDNSADDDNEIRGNLIGLDPWGAPAPNDIGVRLTSLGGRSTVGAISAGGALRNVIAYNTAQGVLVQLGTNNRILGNSIHSNGALGVDLAPIGLTPNDVGDLDVGANALLNYPVFSAATTTAESLFVTGVYNSFSGQAMTFHLYGNPACDPSGNGEGETYLGQGTATTAAGSTPVSIRLGTPVALGTWVTCLAISPTGNTSEFSACIQVVNTPTGSGVVVVPVDSTTGATPVTVTFTDVTASGNVSLVTSATGPSVPGGFALPDPVVYYDISTTATFTGTIEVCVQYDEGALTGPEAGVRLLHYDSGSSMWEDVTSSLDTGTNTVCGTTSSLSPFVVANNILVGADDRAPLPTQFALHANVPNPFNPVTTIRYDVATTGTLVTLRIYDVSGRLVQELINEPRNAGTYAAIWDGRDRNGTSVASGVYFYRMEAGAFVQSRKMVLLK